MKAIAKFAVPAALAIAAFSAGAQTIETDYPVVRTNGAMPETTQIHRSPQAPAQSEPFLVQSNYEGVRVNPAQAPSSTLTRAEVQQDASIVMPFGAAHNA